MTQARRSGATWKIAGVALMVVGMVSGVALGGPGSLIWMKSKLLFTILVILPTIIIFAGNFLFWRGRQYAAQAYLK
jgi:hypothetical protein